MRKKEILDITIEKEKKYFDLVWYARSYAFISLEAAVKARERIEKEYPKETAALNDLDSCDWEHGFNSGMLAGMRYILTLFETGIGGGKDVADEEFPFLDT